MVTFSSTLAHMLTSVLAVGSVHQKLMGEQMVYLKITKQELVTQPFS